MNYKEALKELDELDEELLFEMAGMRGIYVKIDNIDFSFYFSEKEASHSIRVKICWNPNKIMKRELNNMELHGDYKYSKGRHAKIVATDHQIEMAREFFKKYKVLFSAVWESQLYDQLVVDFLRNSISLGELITKFEFIDDIDKNIKSELLKCDSIDSLERIVRKYNLFKMND